MPKGKQPPPGPFAAAVSAEIRISMARHRFTARGLAAASGISESYVGKRLRDEAPFTLNDVELICAALGEDLRRLLISAVTVSGRG